ncbi:MAG: ATP-binding cassette domain-containing protein [Clostridia bacterium]
MSLELKNFYLAFENKMLIKNANVTFNKGIINHLQGKNGAGKTTLLQAICGFVPSIVDAHAKGEIVLNGVQIAGLPANEIASKITCISSKPFYFLGSVKEELAFGLENLLYPKQQILTAIDDIACKMNLRNLLNKSPNKLSGGELQRVAFACSFLMPAEVILIDEGFSKLDTESKILVGDYLRESCNDKIIIVVDHTEYFKDTKKYLIEDGEIIEYNS